jgi:hypothetical protein
MHHRLLTLWQALPLKFLWLLVLFSAFLLPWLQRKQSKPGEFYPFSNFPMYSKFAPNTYYVMVTDLQDNPIPITPLTGKVLSNLKKTYDTELRTIKAQSGPDMRLETMPLHLRSQAGQKTLTWLNAFIPSPDRSQLGGLRLKQINISWKDGSIQKETLPVGELKPL